MSLDFFLRDCVHLWVTFGLGPLGNDGEFEILRSFYGQRRSSVGTPLEQWFESSTVLYLCLQQTRNEKGPYRGTTVPGTG